MPTPMEPTADYSPRPLVFAAVGVALLVVFVGGVSILTSRNDRGDSSASDVTSSSSATSSNEIPTSEETAFLGTFSVYSPTKLNLANRGDVVLFFTSDTCQSCSILIDNLRNTTIPDGLAVLITNYDVEADLRRKYGVNNPHTLVQVTASGDLIAKWTKSYTLDEIISQLK